MRKSKRIKSVAKHAFSWAVEALSNGGVVLVAAAFLFAGAFGDLVNPADKIVGVFTGTAEVPAAEIRYCKDGWSDTAAQDEEGGQHLTVLSCRRGDETYWLKPDYSFDHYWSGEANDSFIYDEGKVPW